MEASSGVGGFDGVRGCPTLSMTGTATPAGLRWVRVPWAWRWWGNCREVVRCVEARGFAGARVVGRRLGEVAFRGRKVFIGVGCV